MLVAKYYPVASGKPSLCCHLRVKETT